MNFQIKNGKIQGEIKDGWYEIKKTEKSRSLSQNSSLHLLFKQISDECLDKGIEMRELIRDEVPIECTPENIKWMWKLLQKALFETKSTTELKRTGEIDIVYRNFSKIIAERTKGEVIVPEWPSVDTQFPLDN